MAAGHQSLYPVDSRMSLERGRVVGMGRPRIPGHAVGAFVLGVLLAALVGCGGAGGDSTHSDKGPPEPDSPSPSPVPRLWVSTNPGGGGAFSHAALGPGGVPMVVATDLSGVAISEDGGRSWRVAGAFAGLDVTHVASVAVDTEDPRRIYAGTEDGLYGSQDGGRRFRRLGVDGYVSAVVARGDRLYAGVESAFDRADAALLLSEDAGKSWERISLPEGRYIVALKLPDERSDRALVLTGQGRFAEGPAELYLYESALGALRRIGAALRSIVDAQFDPGDSSVVWATTDDPDPGRPGWLWRSEDMERWDRVSQHGGVLWLPADRPGTVRLIDPRAQFPWDSRNGVWESSDRGLGWRRVAQVGDWRLGWSRVYYAYTEGFGGPVPSLAFDPVDGDGALWVNSQWAYRSLDGGRRFEPVFTDEVRPGWWRSRGLDNVVVADIALDADGKGLYVGYWDLGCFRSVDGGASWANCNTTEYSGDWEGYGGFTGTVAADPRRPGVVWAAHAPDWASDAVLLRSDDHGATWTPTEGLPAAPDLLGLSVNPASPTGARELLVTVGGDVYRSVDDGITWSLDFACGGCRTTAFDAAGAGYAGGEAGLWRRGRSGWVSLGPGWEGGVRGPPWTEGWRGVAAIAPGPDGVLWVARFGEGGGVYRWSESGRQRVLPGPYYRDVAVDPRHPDVIYAASSSAMEQGGYDERSKGLQVSVDGGRNWRGLVSGLAWPFVTQVRVGQGRVVIGSPGTGVAVGR